MKPLYGKCQAEGSIDWMYSRMYVNEAIPGNQYTSSDHVIKKLAKSSAIPSIDFEEFAEAHRTHVSMVCPILRTSVVLLGKRRKKYCVEALIDLDLPLT